MQAYELGALIGQRGWAVLTGGYIGTMEAVSRGAAEHGSHVIGITCDEIERWRPVKPNPWVMEERRFPTLKARLSGLIEGGDAAIALPGGVGTLTEIALTWNQLLTHAIPPRPLILLGESWRLVIAHFMEELGSYVPDSQRAWVQFAETPAQAIALLDQQA
jgi:hypothetical protein